LHHCEEARLNSAGEKGFLQAILSLDLYTGLALVVGGTEPVG
jgi:hypothetical protein